MPDNCQVFQRSVFLLLKKHGCMFVDIYKGYAVAYQYFLPPFSVCMLLENGIHVWSSYVLVIGQDTSVSYKISFVHSISVRLDISSVL